MRIIHKIKVEKTGHILLTKDGGDHHYICHGKKFKLFEFRFCNSKCEHFKTMSINEDSNLIVLVMCDNYIIIEKDRFSKER